MKSGRQRSLIPVHHRDLLRWPAPDEQSMSDSDRRKYNKRKRAVELYAARVPLAEIRAETGHCDVEIRRFVKRCISHDGCGAIFGFRALIRGFRVSGYNRTADVVRIKGDGHGGCAGALHQLFSLHEDMEEYVLALLFPSSSASEVHESRLPYTEIHARFCDRLREKGFTSNQYPFNTKNEGRSGPRNSDSWLSGNLAS